MNKDFVEDIVPGDYRTRGSYTPAKKIDLGDHYLIFVSGIQAPKEDDSHRVVTDDVEEQTRLVFEDIKKILSLAGASIDDVVKAVIYITDMNDFDKISPIRADYFKNCMPVSSLIEANRMTRDGAKIEVEVTAILKKQNTKNNQRRSSIQQLGLLIFSGPLSLVAEDLAINQVSTGIRFYNSVFFASSIFSFNIIAVLIGVR